MISDVVVNEEKQRESCDSVRQFEANFQTRRVPRRSLGLGIPVSAAP